jgi:hypothetical protein
VSTEHGESPTPFPAGPVLVLWILLTLMLQGAIWVSGARSAALAEAVEFGTGRVESLGVGEVGDDVIRKAIAIQHDTSTFWTVLALFGDFVVEPLSLVVRAGTVAMLFGGIALLRSRPGSFASGFSACALAQGFWVLGLAVRAALAIGLKRSEIETSPTLLLPPGTHPGAVWATLQQFDIFALLGWLAMAKCGIVRMRVGAISSVLICLVLFLIEAIVRLQFSLVIEAGMRLTLLPEV